MPALELDILKLLKEDYTKYTCFIETGTFCGETIFAFEPYFERLFTIEFSEFYYNNTKKKYLGDKIDFINGDSSIVFSSLLPTIREKCIFFLDGHYSSGNTGQSTKDCPLNEEITHINNHFVNEAIIIIDDFRLFGTSDYEDWSSINKDDILEILSSRINCVYHLDSAMAKNDRLIIHINAK
jgi:hypothetical protein